MENATPHRLTPPAWSLASPSLIYAVTWMVILALFQLRLSIILQPISWAALGLVLASVSAALALSLCIYLFLPRLEPHSAERTADDLNQLYRWRYALLVFWCIGMAFEVVVSRGIPIVWLLRGDTRTYADFGIPSVHGLLSACYFVIVTITAMEIFLHGRTRRWLMLGLLFVWPVLLLSRGQIMWMALEVLGVFLLCRPVRARLAAAFTAAALVFVIVFGIIGDVRSGARGVAALRGIVAPEAAPLMSALPSGVFWVYVYTTTPLNNVSTGLGKFEPVGTFYFSIQALVPSIVRETIFQTGERKFPLGLVNEAFNTSTWFVGWLADFGVAGTVAGTSVLLAIALLFYRSARAWRPWAIIGYAACFQAIVLSAFTDTFTSLVTVMQLLIALTAGAAGARRAWRKGLN